MSSSGRSLNLHCLLGAIHANHFILFSFLSGELRRREQSFVCYSGYYPHPLYVNPWPHHTGFFCILHFAQWGMARKDWPGVQFSWGFSVHWWKWWYLWQYGSPIRSLWPFQALFRFPKTPLSSRTRACFALRAGKVTVQGRIWHFCHGWPQHSFVYLWWHQPWR